jgi:glucosamine-6-phosphate deaminase
MMYTVLRDPDAVAKQAAQKIKETIDREVARKGVAVIGLATGSTPLPLYKELVRMNQAGEISFKNVITFNLDEYVGDDQYKRFMHEYLFDQLKPEDRPKEIHIPNGKADDPHQEAARYEQTIKDAGGIDLQILGIGQNGHIGFNEPNKQDINSPTHVVNLDVQTIAINKEKFGEAHSQAITTGLRTIMQAKEIVLLATGKEKTEVIDEMIKSKRPNKDSIANLPAAVLNYHKNAVLLMDLAAAGNSPSPGKPTTMTR